MSSKTTRAIADLKSSMAKTDPNFAAKYAANAKWLADTLAKDRADRELAKVRATPAYKAAEAKANAALDQALNTVPVTLDSNGGRPSAMGMNPELNRLLSRSHGERMSDDIAEMKRTLSQPLGETLTTRERVSKLLGKAIAAAR